MARARSIKPSLFKNELLGTIDPQITLLFISLWTLSDKSGRLEDRPLRIKAETFPYRENIDVNGYLTQLQQLGFIERYEVDGLKIISICKFEEHQSPHSTEKVSQLPAKPIQLPAKPMNTPLTVNVALNNESGNVDSNINVLTPDSLFIDSLFIDSLFIDSSAKPKKEKAVATAPPFDFSKSLSEMGVEKKLIDAWLTVRKKKRGVNTEFALDGFLREVKKANLPISDVIRICAEKSWCSFEASYLQNMQHQKNTAYQFQTKSDQAKDFFNQITGASKNEPEIIDIN